MRVVVTGGGGFIGEHLIRLLLTRQAITDITIFDIRKVPPTAGCRDVRVVEGDVRDRTAVLAVVQRADAVVHLAARVSVPESVTTPVGTHDVNCTGTVNVLDACRRTGAHMVFTSSAAVYGDREGTILHEHFPVDPQSPYAASKAAAEANTLAFMAAYGMPTLVLRLFNVYGPGQREHAYPAVIPAFVRAAVTNRPVILHGDGTHTRDFVYVGTVARVLADAVEHQLYSTQPVNVASGTGTSLNELVDELSHVVGHPLVVRREGPRPGDIAHSRADVDRMRTMFPRVTPVELTTGLSTTLSWARNHCR